ncbi:MAG TPA: phenylalanine--tRNA ligase subunit beta [Kiritimatiellia bacterium]|nr:phenylalanine--tRNA ligase subunit beta [Kiritimatiellia bacterium]
MKVPLSWLKEYVDVNASPEDIARALTFAGIEIEAIQRFGLTATGIVIGEVRSVEPHPNADKLRVCRVFDGASEVHVVCGAPNVVAGGKYPFAPLGAVLDNGAFAIKKAKLRGVESFGMLCAADELGLSSDHDGLLVLDPALPPGTPFDSILPPPETVFEVEITPNRPDCLGIIGIAREIAAAFGLPLKTPDVSFPEGPESVHDVTTIEVQDPHACPRYTARILRGVTLAPSPEWIARRLEHAGIRAINNVVDITNYVMLECGQPLHAFDHALLHQGRILVRHARPGETLATLDDIERPIDPSMLVIADASRPVALAGVMGGAGSEIRDTTRDVLLESACFHPSLVRATAKKVGLSTESSYRFERIVDIERVEWASRRAAQLLVQIAGATAAAGVIDIYPAPPAPRQIILRHTRVRDLLGLPDLPATDIHRHLQAIGLSTAEAPHGASTVTIPTFRPDLEAEVDLIEEVARLHGLHNIPPRLSASVNPAANDDPARRAESLKATMVSLGFQEIITYSLASRELLDLFDPATSGQRVSLLRPVTTDQAILRPRLIPQMAETLGRNRSRQIRQAALFELSRAYTACPDAPPAETLNLCAGLIGLPQSGGMTLRRDPSPEEMFFHIKGLWERLAASYPVPLWTLAPSTQPWLEPGMGVDILLDQTPIGVLGLLARNLAKEWRFQDPVGLLEIDSAILIGNAPPLPVHRPLPTYPSTSRDIALLADASLKHQTIVDTIRKNSPPELENVELFDIFQGESIGHGKRSLAYSLTYRSPEKTLTDEEANRFHEAIKATLKTTLGVDIREG